MAGEDLATRDVADVIDHALSIGDSEDNRYWELVRELQRRGDSATCEAAVTLCSNPSAAARELGLDILAQLGYKAGRPFLEETLPTAFRLCSAQEPKPVLISAISALGHLYDVRAQPYLLEQVRHPDEDIRLAVAQALPNVAGDPPTATVVAALIELTRDSDSDVRDWATFGLGSKVDVDDEQIRETLFARVDDPNGDTRGEALVGLAVRGDRRIVDRVLNLLDNPDVGNLIIEAAEKLPDRRYLPALYQLRDLGRESEIASALEACEGTEAGQDDS